jgi:hypothetical protein
MNLQYVLCSRHVGFGLQLREPIHAGKIIHLGGTLTQVPDEVDLIRSGFRCSFYSPCGIRNFYYSGPASLVNAACEEHENVLCLFDQCSIMFIEERCVAIGDALMSEYASTEVDHPQTCSCAADGCETVVLKKCE